jgi:hypothetical protein
MKAYKRVQHHTILMSVPEGAESASRTSRFMAMKKSLLLLLGTATSHLTKK